MTRRIVGAVLLLLGLALAAVAVGSATWWRPADRITATYQVTGSTPSVVTEPGVLELYANTVQITVTPANGGPVLVAIGRDTDVAGWLKGSDYVRLTGLSSATTLVGAGPASPSGTPGASSSVAAAPSATSAASPPAPADPNATPRGAGSDLWVKQVTSTTPVNLDWQRTKGRWSMLVTSAEGRPAAASISMTWPHPVATPLLVPGTVGGGALALLGLLLLVVRPARKKAGPAVGPVPAPVTVPADAVSQAPAGAAIGALVAPAAQVQAPVHGANAAAFDQRTAKTPPGGVLISRPLAPAAASIEDTAEQPPVRLAPPEATAIADTANTPGLPSSVSRKQRREERRRGKTSLGSASAAADGGRSVNDRTPPAGVAAPAALDPSATADTPPTGLAVPGQLDGPATPAAEPAALSEDTDPWGKITADDVWRASRFGSDWPQPRNRSGREGDEK